MASIAFVLTVFCQYTASAQPSLNFKRVINNWPTVELYFTVACSGTPSYVFSPEQNFKVFENGLEIPDFTLWCPDPSTRCAVSVALVLDASGSMTGAGNTGTIAAGNAFIDLMDGTIDQASVVWFESTVTIRQTVTSNKAELRTAVNELPANGATACWDGIYTGVQELIASGSNPCRSVIALTDGGDNSSNHTPQDIIALANRNRIRIFTVGLGGVEPTNLELIALLTGGKFYQTNDASNLTMIFQEIGTIIFGGFLECLITYQAQCMDGGLRTVDLSLLNFCGGNDTKTKTYRAPKDTSTFTSIEIAIDKRSGNGGSETRLPITLATPINPLANFERASFSIRFDPNLLHFKRVETPPGTLLEGVQIDASTPVNGIVDLHIMNRKPVLGSGILAELVFDLENPADSVNSSVSFVSWNFESGCFKPVLKDGEIYIMTGIEGPGGALPSVFWLGQNTPNPFNPSTTIEYSVPHRTAVKLSVVDLQGKHVATLVNEEQNAGSYRVTFNAASLSSGMYFYKLETPDYSDIKRMVLTK